MLVRLSLRCVLEEIRIGITKRSSQLVDGAIQPHLRCAQSEMIAIGNLLQRQSGHESLGQDLAIIDWEGGEQLIGVEHASVWSCIASSALQGAARQECDHEIDSRRDAGEAEQVCCRDDEREHHQPKNLWLPFNEYRCACHRSRKKNILL